MKVKICGITNLEDARQAIDAGADALGFVLAPEAKKRNRYIALEDAAAIIDALPPLLTTVAVTVNASRQNLDRYLKVFDRVQLHGEEPPELYSPAHRTLKAFRAGNGLTVAQMQAYETAAWLLDAYVPGERGGTGKTCDWNLARAAVETGQPVILAGGLDPENVAQAIKRVRPYGVDVSGGVEAAPGKKDHERIRRFIDAAKTSLA